MKLDDNDKGLLLLGLLPTFFKHFKNVFHYDKELTIILEKVQSAIRVKRLTKMKDLKVKENGEDINVLKIKE